MVNKLPKSISLKKLLGFLDQRIKMHIQTRAELVLSLNTSFGVRGSVMQYPLGGKKGLRQTIRRRITECEGRIRELELLLEYFTSI